MRVKEENKIRLCILFMIIGSAGCGILKAGSASSKSGLASAGSDIIEISANAYTVTGMDALPSLEDQMQAIRGQVETKLGKPMAWETILADNFESGDWEKNWTKKREPGTFYTWGRTRYKASEGSYSIWCADDNLDPAPSLLPTDKYANNMDGTIEFGPFDLINCTSAVLSFAVYYEIETGYDRWNVYIEDYEGKKGISRTGSNMKWEVFSLDLGAWTNDDVTVYNLLERQNLKLIFRFRSDVSVTKMGAFIDNVILMKYKAGDPDFSVKNFTATPPRQPVGGVLNTAMDLINPTAFTAVQSKMQYYLSTDSQINTSLDRLLETKTVPLIQGDDTVRVEQILYLPTDAGPGTYYVAAVLDVENNVNETNEANNIFQASGTVQVGPCEYEIIAREDFEDPSWEDRWSRYHLGGHYDWGRNTYTAHSGTYSLWCSDRAEEGHADLNPAVDTYDYDQDTFFEFGPFSLKNCTEAYITYALWYQIETSWDHVKMQVDDGTGWEGIAYTGDKPYWMVNQASLNQFVGKDNLKLAFRFRSDAIINWRGAFLDDVVLIKRTGSLSDLTCTSITFSPAESEPGGGLFIDYTVRELNGSQSGETTVQFYLSTDQTITAEDYNLGFKTVPTLNGSSTSGQLMCVVPTNIADGNYYIGAIADPNSSVIETDETNNTAKASSRLKVETEPSSDVAAESAVPEYFQLGQNYPNPFNPSTTIEMAIPRETRGHIEIFDITGKLIFSEDERPYLPGMHQFHWDGKNQLGQKAASGVYLYRFESVAFRSIRKMTLID